MKTLIRIGLLLAALVGPWAQAAVDAPAAEALMKRSGLWQQLATVGPQARAGLVESMRRQGQRPSDAEVERLLRALDAAFDVDRLRAAARSTIAAGLDPAHLPALEGWYGSAAGTGLTRIEEQAAQRTGAMADELQAGVALLEAMAEDRRALLAELVEVTQAAEAMVELMAGVTIATLRGAASVAAPGTPLPTAEALRREFDAQRPQMLRAYGAMMLASSARTYEPAALGDLAAYVDFLRSDAGRHYNRLGIDALIAAMSEAAAEMGRRMPGTADRSNA